MSKCFSPRTTLSESADNCRKNGCWRINGNVQSVNGVNDGVLLAFAADDSGNVVYQQLYNNVGGILYTRRYWFGIWSNWADIALKSDSGIVNYKDRITSDFVSSYNGNSQQACIVTQTNGTKFAIINLSFRLKDGYKSGTEKEIMMFPLDLVPAKNVVLQFFANRKVGFAYLRSSSRTVIVTLPIDISSDTELDLLGNYQIV